MNITSPFFTLTIDPDQGYFSTQTGKPQDWDIRRAQIRVSIRRNGKKLNYTALHWRLTGEALAQASLHGPLHRLTFACGLDEQLELTLDFALPTDHALLLWRASLMNRGQQPIEIDRIVMLHCQGDLLPEDGRDPHGLAFYSNGWQSWCFSAAYGLDERQQRTRLVGIQHMMWENPDTPRAKGRGHFSSDLYGVVGSRTSRTGLVLGFLSEQRSFGTLNVHLKSSLELELWANGEGTQLNPGATRMTDWAAAASVQLDAAEPLAAYMVAVGRENQVSVPKQAPAGWCSWYEFYQRVTEADMQRNLDVLQARRAVLPVDLVQLDDGFETKVGDWRTFRPGFPRGVAPLSQQIKAAGFTPGIWLAPFIVEPNSQLARQHPHWLLRNRLGFPVNAGYQWGALAQALDLTVPGVLDWVEQLISTAVTQWGYPYLKLDFLYAAALKARRADPTRTRAEVLRQGLEVIRKAAGEDTFILGCGCPLGPAIGLVDAMRIGADVSGNWHPDFNGFKPIFEQEPNFPSARNAIQNILTRAPMHRHWWFNDPDCLLVRPDTHLTLSEIQTLASVIGLTGGLLLISDDLSKVPEDRLRIAEVLLPVLTERAQILDWFDRVTPTTLRLDMHGAPGAWQVLAFFNWADRPIEKTLNPVDFRLPAGEYWVSSFWQGQAYPVVADDALWHGNIQAHSGVVLAVRARQPQSAVYVGSDLHLSQGVELTQWQESPDGLQLELNAGRSTHGNIHIALPGQPSGVQVNGQAVEWRAASAGLIQVPVQLNPGCLVHITYSGE